MEATQAGAVEWGVLIGVIAVLLVLDLVVMRSRGGVMTNRGAALASVFWVGVYLAGAGALTLIALLISKETKDVDIER